MYRKFIVTVQAKFNHCIGKYNGTFIENNQNMHGYLCIMEKRTMKDALNVGNGEGASKKRGKVKTIKETGFAAGLAALEALESSDIAALPATLTARVLVQEGIGTIVRLRAKNVPLLRIYNDMRRASGMKITFATFAGYVSDAARRAGLKFEKVKSLPRVPASTGAGLAVPRSDDFGSHRRQIC